MRLKSHLPFLPFLRSCREVARRTLTSLTTPHVQAFSQEGEDMILARIFEWQERGFYVDVGAHHPSRFSNTSFFYRKGWRGINVDAMPGSMAAFRRERPRDQNIEAAVGSDAGSPGVFYIFNETALNTFDAALAKSRVGGPYHIVEEREIRPVSLKEILNKHLPAGQAIDFLSVDVEGADLEVLRSNDWRAYRPRYVLAECLGQRWSDLPADAVYQYLAGQRYEPFAKTVNTLIFEDRAASPDASGIEPGA